MSPLCAAPDPSVGIAVRLSRFLDCQARVLGENGFLGLAGGPLGSTLLTTVVTILVAWIGYRLILGDRPTLANAVGWALRIGIALALIGSWPAFQTLIYKVVTDGPVEIADAILSPSGLPSGDLSGRIQQAYDTIRLGSAPATNPATTPGLEQRLQFEGAAPKTSVGFLVGTVGLLAAIRVCVGFLLAIGPLPILAIVLSGGGGLFAGWLRALAGAAFAAAGVTTVTAIQLLLVESELARLQGFRSGAVAGAADPQALTAIVLIGLMMAVAVMLAAVRVASKLAISPALRPWRASSSQVEQFDRAERPLAFEAPSAGAKPAREQQIVQSLLTASGRDRLRDLVAQPGEIAAAHGSGHQHTDFLGRSSTGASRRRLPRRTRLTSRREMLR